MGHPYGKLVDVGNGKLNVYTEGQGTRTVVVLSGAGVTSPVLEYKMLYRRLTDVCRISVIEKSGYGLSGSTGTERTVENLVKENRQALIGAGLEPPYILMPHSYAGFETIYWANSFPGEIAAVISMDMGLPESAAAMGEVMTPEKVEASIARNRRLYARIRKRGLLAKLFRNKLVNVSGMMDSADLSQEEKQLYETLFYQNLGNEDMLAENKMLVPNAEAAGKTGMLSVPAFFYISDMKVPMKSGSWREHSVRYAERMGAAYKLTDAGHLMYAKIPDQMAADFKQFLQSLT